MSYFPQFSPGSLFLQSFQNELYGTIQKLKGDAKDALEHNNNAFALDAYNEAISLALRISLRPEELGTLHCNRSLVYYNLKDYRNSLHDATQATICYPGFNKGYFRQGLAHKGLNEPINALSRFIEAINVCRQINSKAQDMVACYAAMINILCEVEDIFDLESQITDPESNEVKDLILQRLSSNGQWKAITYLLLGAITGADSKLARSFSNCNCSDLLVLKVFAETSDTQKKEWGCKLAIKLLQNGASFQEFENGLDENVIRFGINITLQTGNAEFLKYLLTSHTIEPSKINAQINGDTALHILVKDLKIRKTTIGETIIGLLINHGCRLDIKDNAGKTPIEYTSITDPVFRLLQNASNNSTGGGISTSISRIRMNGKDAFQAGNFNKALKIYTEGLANCSHKRDFKNEAILYTNRATVYNKLKQHEMALTDAETAIQADPTWHKGYWRKGTELCILRKYDDAFETFLCGFEVVQPVCDVKDKIDLIIGAVIAFPNIRDKHKEARYTQLGKQCFIQFWPRVLNRLSKESEWLGIRYLILGLNIEIKPDNTGCGIASSFDTSKMQLNTVFKFIEKTRDDRSVVNWLTPTLTILLFKHEKQFMNFKQDASDTYMHAAVRYALITGDVSLLQLMPIQGNRSLDTYRNGNQDSPYHIMTNNKYTQDRQLMRKVVSILREKDLAVSFRDDKHHLPKDYDLKEQFGGLHDELKRTSSSGDSGLKIRDQLLQIVEKELLNKDYTTALQACFSALSTFNPLERQNIDIVNKELSSLFRNMTECHLNLGNIAAALMTVGDSVRYNPTCYKGHYIGGDVCFANKNYEHALASYVNALLKHCNSRRTNDISIIVEIIKKICLTFMRLDKTTRPANIQAAIPVSVAFNIWAPVLYSFIQENNLVAAKFIELYIRTLHVYGVKIDLDLRPLCETKLLEKFPECMYFIAKLIRCGCNFTNLSTQETDTFTNAAVRMTYLTGISDVLRDICLHLHAGHKRNITDFKGNSGLHVAAAGKIVKPNIARNDVIEILVKTNINPHLKNNDGKLAIDLLPTEDNVSKRVLREYMRHMIDFEDVTTSVHSQRDCSTATKNKPEIFEAVKPKLQTKQIYTDEDHTHKDEDKCNTCQETFDKCKTSILENPSLAFKDLLRVFRLNHRHSRHKETVEKSVLLISDFLAETTDFEIPDELCRIAQKIFDNLMNDLIKREKWKQIYKLVTKHNKVHGEKSLCGFASQIRLEKVINDFPNEMSSNLMEMTIDCFIQNGCRVDQGGKVCIQTAVEKKQYLLLQILICNHHCDPQYLIIDSCSSPIHSAFILGLSKDPGNFSVFKTCMDLFGKYPNKYVRLDPRQKDNNGDTLFHLVVKRTCTKTLKQMAEILLNNHVPCKVQNKDGKLPLDYLKVGDQRYKILQKAMEYDRIQIKTDQPTIHKPTVEIKKDPDPLVVHMLCQEGTKHNVKIIDSKHKIQPETIKESYLSQIEKLICSLSQKTSTWEHSNVEPSKEIDPGKITLENEDNEESEFDQIEFEISHDPLEGKPWEVECTSGVLKSLRSNRILPVFKQRIVKIIKALASGIYSKRFFKPLMTDSKSVKLFESKISSASRLIWEVGKQFSPRLTKQCTKPVNIYTDIIRIWEVVIEHKNIHHAVKRIVSSVEMSHKKGAKCLIQKKLKTCGMQVEFNDFNKRQNSKSDNRQFKKPNIYVESGFDTENSVDELSFFPPASPKDTEYSTIKFHTFSSNVAINVLHQMEGEFPFRVTDVEYQITNLPFNAPIVLIGRSGTGKTTCCVYRLWYRFQQFWLTKITDEVIPEDLQRKNPDHCEDENNAATETFIPNEQELINEYGVPEYSSAETKVIQLEMNEKASGGCFDKSSFASKEGANNNYKTEVISEPNFNEDSISTQEYDETTFLSVGEDVNESRNCKEYKDELRQMFITKNGVLCREVQKTFKSFIGGDEKTSRLFKMKDDDLPNRLQDIEEHQYPLFITAKHFWLMLDATLGPPYYFDRHVDGSPKTVIEGWTDIDHMETVLDDAFDSEFSDESESDEEEEELDLHIPLNENKRTRMIKIDPRREVTYEVFEDIIWPRIIGKFKKHTRKYHPSLVWTEIMSIIKGSYEAISEGGILKKDKYFEIGKKQAPAFVDEREVLYNLFLEYERFRQKRHMFDQTDLVQNLYQRFLKQKKPKWKVNEIYVDEAQDFAQAELFLLIKLCESPHGMFVTGDTAQSIMKGISFRFKDLVSLFHHASKELPLKTIGVSVQPDLIYELPHNYRSHSGITSLATSVLDVLTELFPDSFDSLPNDQCLFDGPSPLLLETVSSDRLSLILCDNNRETSKIEFGAHQVILVVNDKSRNNIPNKMKSGLVLTLYEAKGLEFDDVLLYNIFTDSEATKEWRVVFSFLEKLARNKSKKESRRTLQISADSRPLTFDPKQHKVLNSELKQLYTAITRARQNVWIFDEDKDKRKPMFEYFKALHLVDVVPEDKEVKSFTSKSSSTEWIATGEKFMQKKMYIQAAQCFNTAGDSRKEDIANAFQNYKNAILKSQNSPERKEELYQATINFLKARKTKEAAKCLETAKHFDLAARVYAKRQHFEKVAEMYRITEKPLESSKYYERAGRFEKAIDVLLENNQFENAIHSLNRYERLKKESPDPEQKQLRIKLRENQTEDQIYRNAAEYYHKNKECGEMKKALNRISDIHFRVKFLKERFDDKNDYINLAASIYKEKGQTRNAARLYFEYGYTQDALHLFKKDKATYMIGRCLFLDSLMKITIKPDGSAICSNSTSIEETQIQIEQAIYYFDRCQNRYWDTKCNNGKISDELAQSYLLLGRLTGQQRFVKVAFSIFIKRKPHANEVGKLECLNWMINHSNIKLESNLSEVVIGMENMFNIFLILVPLSKLSTNITEQKRNQFLRDCGIENEIGILFYNPIHKPRILSVMGKNPDLVTRKTVKTIIDDIPDIYKTIVKDLLTKGKVWFSKIRSAIEDELQKLKTFSLPTGQFENIGDRSRKVSFTPSEFLQLICLDMHNVKLESFLNECIKKLDLRWEQKRILYQFELKRFPFSKCRRLMEDLINTVPHISNAKSDLLQSLNGVQSQMEIYFESELKFSNKIAGNVARMFEVIFFHKILGLQRNVNDSLTNLESMVLRKMKKTTLSRQNAFQCGFISKLNVHKPFAMSVVRSFKESLDCLIFRRNPSIALKKFCIFIERITKSQTKETIPELTLLLIWVRYFTLVGFSMQSKVCGMQNSGKKCHFVIPSSYFTTFKFVERCVFYSKTWTTEAIIGASKLMLNIGEISDLLENNIEIMAGIRGNINIISIVFRRLDEYLQLQESPKQLLKDNEALSSIIDMAEDVISLSMVYIINMGEGMSCRLESFLLKEFALLRCNETYPKHISEVIEGIQHSSGIADICICVSNFLKQKGDSLIKCVWDNKTNRILKAEIESVINTRETFFLPCTIEILSEPTLSAEKTNDEIQTEEQEIEIDEEEVRTVCDDHDTIRKKEIESILQTVRAEQSKQSGTTIEYDEFLDDSLFAGIISVNETRCDVCGNTFKSEGIDDKEDEEGAEINTSIESVTESPLSTKSNLIGLKSIPRSLSSTADETMSGETPTKAQSRIKIKHLFDVTSNRSAQCLSQRSVSSESQENKEFFRSLSSIASSDELAPMTMNSFEEHRESLSHKSQMKQIQDFYTYYKQELKPGLDEVRAFISKYELFSGDASERYGGDEIRVSKLLSSFEECNAYIADIITLKHWRQTRQVKEKIELLVNFQNGLNDSVKDLFSVPLKTETLEVEMTTEEELEYKPHNEKRKRKRRGKGKKAWRTIDFDAM